MKRKKYIYTNKIHPQSAIMATVLGTISLVSLAIVVYLTFRNAGTAQPGYGMTGFLAAIFSMVGFVLGALSLKIKDCFRVFPILGTILNLVSILCLVFIYRLGVG